MPTRSRSVRQRRKAARAFGAADGPRLRRGAGAAPAGRHCARARAWLARSVHNRPKPSRATPPPDQRQTGEPCRVCLSNAGRMACRTSHYSASFWPPFLPITHRRNLGIKILFDVACRLERASGAAGPSNASLKRPDLSGSSRSELRTLAFASMHAPGWSIIYQAARMCRPPSFFCSFACPSGT